MPTTWEHLLHPCQCLLLRQQVQPKERNVAEVEDKGMDEAGGEQQTDKVKEQQRQTPVLRGTHLN